MAVNGKIYIARKDILNSGYDGNLQHGIVHDKAGEKVDAYNGHFVTIGGLMEGNREVVKATLTDAGDLDKEVYFIHNSEIMYDERLDKKEDFFLQAGKVSRLYQLTEGDILTMTLDCYNGTPKVGETFGVGANGKLAKLGADATAKYTFEVIENSGRELHINQDAYAVKVHRG